MNVVIFDFALMYLEGGKNLPIKRASMSFHEVDSCLTRVYSHTLARPPKENGNSLMYTPSFSSSLTLIKSQFKEGIQVRIWILVLQPHELISSNEVEKGRLHLQSFI